MGCTARLLALPGAPLAAAAAVFWALRGRQEGRQAQEEAGVVVRVTVVGV